jgi:hypothetical protein
MEDVDENRSGSCIRFSSCPILSASARWEGCGRNPSFLLKGGCVPNLHGGVATACIRPCPRCPQNQSSEAISSKLTTCDRRC